MSTSLERTAEAYAEACKDTVLNMEIQGGSSPRGVVSTRRGGLPLSSPHKPVSIPSSLIPREIKTLGERIATWTAAGAGLGLTGVLIAGAAGTFGSPLDAVSQAVLIAVAVLGCAVGCCCRSEC